MRSLLWLIPLSASLLLLAGCEEEKRVLPPGAGGAPANPPAAKNEIIRPREILGKTTQDIRSVEEETKKGGQNAPMHVTAKDPITMGGNVYVVAVDQIAAGNVRHAIDLYQAETGHYPKDRKEFMEEVIKVGKPDGISLPRLPYYQEYGYDEKDHKLIVLEYPDRKTQFQQQQNKELGGR